MACAMLPADDAGAPRRAVGNLWAAGLTVDWRALEPLARAVPLPPYPFERVRHRAGARRGCGAAGKRRRRLRGRHPVLAIRPSSSILEGLIAAVALVWQQQLGHRQVAADSDFHALGGDLLLAARRRPAEPAARRRPAAACAARMAYAACACRAHRRLADRCCSARSRTAVRGCDAARRGRRALVPAACRRRLADLYRDLVAALPATLPVYGLQAAALDGRTPPDWTVAAAAGRCVAALRAVQPAGPYRLAGSSFGGMLAYEMARQLVAAGERVALLALLDTPAMEELPRELADMADIAAYVGLLGRPRRPPDCAAAARGGRSAG
ncbi:MAG: thioesterase domain-containing protein [Geminicoccaceae bacterium]